VVALTDSDAVNLKIAITVKLLNPGLPVICRAESSGAEKNMLSFGTDQVINPFETFGDRLALAAPLARASPAAPVAEQRSGQRAAHAAVPAPRAAGSSAATAGSARR
jgi:Trk K+ transport system NAD-binding subunit